MNTKPLITTILIAASLLLNARADLTTGLVCYWKFTDGPGFSTAADSSGNANNGTLTGFSDTTFNNMWTTAADPNNGWPYALLLNQGETADYVSVPESTSVDSIVSTRKFTLAAWVQLSVACPANPGAAIICKGNGGGESWCLDIYNKHFRVFMRNTSGANTMNVESTFTPSQGVWYHVVGTYDVSPATSKEILYINGVANANSGSGSLTTIYNNVHVASIGNRQSASAAYNLPFPGTIDEVRIYNRTLSAAEVLQLYNNEAFPVINNGLGAWNGLAGSGGNATVDTTSLNFCTNLYSASLGTGTLADVFSLETGSLTVGCSFGDNYLTNGQTTAVVSTNLAIATGGVALGTTTIRNTVTTYTFTSPDTTGIKDGATATSLAKFGLGTVTLAGTNTFSGGTTINFGTVQLGNGGAVTGQELGTAATVTDNGALVFNGTNNLTFNNTISGTGSVTQKGSGTLTLSAANTYSGGTTIINNTMPVAVIGDIGSGTLGTGVVTLNSATLLYTGAGETTARQVNGTAGTTNTIDVPSSVTLELSGRVTGSAAWLHNPPGTRTLTLSGSGDNSFLGMNVLAGTVILNKTGGHAIGNPLTVASGATVQMGIYTYDQNIYNASGAPVTVSSGGVFDMNGQATSSLYSLSVSGTGIGGTGALINSVANSTSTLTVKVTLAADTTIGGDGILTLPSMINGSGKLTYSGAGTLTLGTQNIYSGETEVTSGTLAATAALAIPNNVTISGTGAFDATVANAVPGNVTLTGSGVLQLDDPNALSSVATLTLPSSPADNTVYLNFWGANTIAVLMIGSVAQPAGTYGAIGSGAANQLSLFNSAGMGVLNVTGQADWDPALRTATPGSGGTGYWDTNTANWFTGNADTAWPTDALAYFAGTAGTVTLSTNLNANGLTFGTAGYTLTNNGVSGLTLDGNNPTITVSSGNTTVACPIAESGVNPVTVTGPGRLTLSGANTYTGGTTINGATLSVQMIADANCAIGPSGNVTIQGGGTLSYTGAGAAATVRNIAANGAATSYLDVPAGTLTLSGQVKSGTGSTGQIYTKTGAGTLILGGSTDNSGATMAINRGQVIITKISAGTVHGLGGGVSSVASGAELQLGGSGGYGLYGTCVLSVASGGLFDLNGQNTSMSTLTNSGTGFGSGALINSAAGTTSYLTNGGSGVVLAGATTVGGVGGITLLNAVSGAGPLTYGGSATLTLGAANSFAGGLTVNFGGTVQLNSASGAGTGDVTDNGTLTLNSGSGNWTNRITGGSSSVINIPLGTGNFWILDDLSGFSGTINVTGSSGTPQLVVGNGTNYATAINGSATWNIYANGWVDFNGLQVNPARVNLYGQPISTGTWGALRLDASTQSGDVVLYGNSSIGNGNASPSTISGAIRESGGSYGFTKMGTAANQILILSGTNTYTGPTTISAGVLTIGGAGQLGSGNYATNITNNATFNYASSAAQTLSGVVSGAGNLIQGGTGTLSLSGANTFTGGTTISNGSTLSIIGSGCLGVSGAATNYAVAITNNGAFIYASSAAQTLSGVIFGTGVLTQTGPGALTLSGVNAYTGGIVITNNSTLVLPLGGSVNSASSVSIAAGATLDVSAYSAYSMLSGITLKAGGTGTAVGSTAATIKGSANSGASVTVASPLALTFAPQTFNGDATHPTLYIENISLGQLILSGSAITVNNAGASPLGAGTYSLIQVAPAGSISMGSPGVTVTGNGIIPGATATLSVSGGSVNLMVTAPSLTPVTQMTIGPGSNGKLDINYAGGAGTHFVLLQTNNISASLDTWTRLQTNTVSPGSFSITPGSDPAEFYRVKSE